MRTLRLGRPFDAVVVHDAVMYMLRDGGEPLRVVHDRHVMGVFACGDWMRLLHEAGFVTDRLVDPWERDGFVGVRSPD